MLPSPAPRYYLLGAVLSAVGAVVLWLRVRRRGEAVPRPWAALAVGVVLVVVGIAAISYGVFLGNQYDAGLHTTVMSYDVSVEMNGSWPVRMLLPAPSDPRLFDALNATNGSASLRLNHTATDTNVVLTALGNVTFRVRMEVPSASVAQGFTRLAPCGVFGGDYVCNATIELGGVPPGSKIFLGLVATIGVACQTRLLSLITWIEEGVAEYPAEAPTAVC